MHINLPDDVKEWIKTAESFLEETKPWEVEAEMNSGKVPEEIDSNIGRWQLILDYQVWICQKTLAEKNYPIFSKSLFGKSWAGVQMP